MSATTAPVRYRVEAADLHAHLWRVTLTITEPAAVQELMLPVWIPGSYLVREFARHLQEMRARQGARALGVRQLDKCRWQVICNPAQPLTVEYTVWARDASVRAAWLDVERGFFNPTSLCLRVQGLHTVPHALELPASAFPKGWQLATALMPTRAGAQGFGEYLAQDYDELADSPVELGRFWSGSFSAGGVPHRFIVSGAPPSFDGERLLADAQRICEAAIRFWHPRGRPPHDRYVFLLNAVDDGYGGLEHRHSTALIASRRDLPRLGERAASEGYTTLLGLVSHEYFHTWNVKRLRPSEFTRYDYGSENYTRLLWFFEGFTSYYDDLLLRRSGLIDDATYLKLLGKAVQQVAQTPGRALQSVAQASFDAWVKYYRPDENTLNATVSYYTKGALVALCLDLTLRREGRGTLDAVMRSLWTSSRGGPIDEAAIRAALQAVGGRPFDAEIDAWVHGTGELPVAELLSAHGVRQESDAAGWAPRLGLRVSESSGIKLTAVLRGSAAERAGMAASDEWLGVESAAPNAPGWRLRKLDDLSLVLAPQAQTCTALIARDQRLLRLPLAVPPAAQTPRLVVADAAAVAAWLDGAGPRR